MKDIYCFIVRTLLSVAVILLTGACSGHDDFPADAADGNAPVMVFASAAVPEHATRTGGENEMIRDRKLLFTYPSVPDGKMESLEVEFGADGIGYVYDNNGKVLLWESIYDKGGKDFAVYLDNLVNYKVKEPDFSSDNRVDRCDNFDKIYFGPQIPAVDDDYYKNKYKRMIARENSDEADEVDIIWGKISQPEAGKALKFELEHKMSKISFRFYCDVEDEDIRTLLEDNVKVKLDNLLVWLEDNRNDNNEGSNPFCRKSGVIQNRGAYSYQKNVYIAGSAEEGEKLKHIQGDIYFVTPGWIVPRTTGFNAEPWWPILTIALNDGTSYSGPLPKTMRYWSDKINGFEDRAICFESGYHHVFNVKLVHDLGKRELLFSSVEVFPFTRLPDENTPLLESGIYTWADFVSLVKLYNEDSSEKNYRLMKYGRFKYGEWNIQLWHDIEAASEDVAAGLPKFKEKVPLIKFSYSYSKYNAETGKYETLEKSRTIKFGSKIINADNYNQELLEPVSGE